MRLNEVVSRETVAKTAIRAATFVHLAIPGDPVYANTSALNVVTGGHTWVGVGQLGGVELIAEDTQINGAPIRLTLSGVPSTMLTEILTADYRNQSANVYLGFFDQDWVLLGPLEPIFSGVIDSAQLSVDDSSATVTMTCENELSFLIGRPIPIRYTDQEQRKRFTGDVFFNLLPAQFDLQQEWGGVYVSGGEPDNPFFYVDR